MRYRHTPPLNKIAILLLSLCSVMGVVQADSTSSNLPTIDVYGNHDTAKVRDQAGYDAIYDANYSSDYAGSKVINAYRGTDPADLLRNFTGVYSGDARNGGAIDPNIRGIQGAGRVPVTVDGTEQAMEVSRGYNGITNRNYIDPMLIGSIRIIKDGGYTGDAGFKASIGGGMAIRTIDAEDVLRGRLGFGGEIRLESSSNAAKFTTPQSFSGWYSEKIPLSITCPEGKDRRFCVYMHYPHQRPTGGDFNFVSGHDLAGRIALAYAKENWSVMGAYAYRQRGNYYSGKNGAGFYSAEPKNSNWSLARSMAHSLIPGSEVFNTAVHTNSYLLKAKVRPDSAQSIELGFMRVNAKNGDILPKQFYDSIRNLQTTGKDLVVATPQVPLSTIHLNAYHLKYKLQPEHSKWLDLSLGLWRTDNKGVIGTMPFGTYSSFDPMGSQKPPKKIFDTASMQIKDTRYGFNISNKMQLLDKLSFTVFGSMEHRKTRGGSPFFSWKDYPKTPVNWGRKTITGIGFNLQVQPTDRLTINMGSQFNALTLHDDGLKELLNNDHTLKDLRGDKKIGYKYTVSVSVDAQEWKKEFNWNDINKEGSVSQKVADNVRKAFTKFILDNKTQLRPFVSAWNNNNITQGITITSSSGEEIIMTVDDLKEARKKYGNFIEGLTEFDKFKKEYYDKIYKNTNNEPVTVDKDILVMPRADGKYYFADDPCYNGQIDPNNQVCLGVPTQEVETKTLYPKKKFKDHAWAPFVSVAYQLTDSAKVYARYNESIRFPSIEESIWFNEPDYVPLAQVSTLVPYIHLKPEHSHAFELGYTQNLLNWLPNADEADIKIAYYQNHITNVIDRLDYSFGGYFNLDYMDTKGLELSGRYDAGYFFGNIGVNYLLSDKSCSETYAWYYSKRLSGRAGKSVRIPSCISGGFPWGFLVNQTPPKLSTTLNLGARLLDRKLELSTRMTYYTKYRNKEYDRIGSSLLNQFDAVTANVPFAWGNTLIVDAYVRYKINKHFEAELSGTNLTDQYYLDPATRTLIPAPGRTIKLGLTGRF